MSQPTILATHSGVRFGILGAPPARPAPTIFVFAMGTEETLASDYSQIGQLLADDGYLCVSLDVPGHGADADPEQPNALLCWRQRIESGGDPIGHFTARVRAVLDHLVDEGYSDPQRVCVAGTSRGGFLATHVAAADSRFRCVVAMAPVADLLDLTEFEGVRNPELVEAQSLARLSMSLYERPTWITIGNNDERVNTDSVITFARSVVRAAVAHEQEADIELHVVAEAGHVTPTGAHEQAAAWLRSRMGAVGSGMH